MTTLGPEKTAALRHNLARIASFAATVRERREQAEREAEQAAQDESEHRAALPPVDAAVAEAAKARAAELRALVNRWSDAKAKFNSVDSELDRWRVSTCAADDDLEASIALRNQLRAEMESGRLSFEGSRKGQQRIEQLSAEIAAGKARGLFSRLEPAFSTGVFQSRFVQGRCRRIGRHQDALVIGVAELRDPERTRILEMFASFGVEMLDGDALAIPVGSWEVGWPKRIEFRLPTGEILDGALILETTRDAGQWLAEKEAAREREATAKHEAERETARRERERKLAEFRELMAEAQQQQPITENF